MISNTLNARRRCDDCGIRTGVKSEEVDRCILQCSQCGKEYFFYKSPLEERLMRKMKEQYNMQSKSTWGRLRGTEETRHWGNGVGPNADAGMPA